MAFSCVLTAAWDGTDTGDLLHDKAGRSVCLNQRQPAPMGSFFPPHPAPSQALSIALIDATAVDFPRRHCHLPIGSI